MTTYNGRYIPEFLRIVGIVHERDSIEIPSRNMYHFKEREKIELEKLDKREKE